MGRLNGSLLHRLERVEQRLVPIVVAPPPAEEDEDAAEWWFHFHAAAPGPVWQYVLAINDERLAAGVVDEAWRWVEPNHPAFNDVLEGLYRAFRNDLDMPARLRFTQGWLIKGGYSRLQDAIALERQPLTGGVWLNRVTSALAADALLGWSDAENDAAWLEPERFVDQWRKHYSRESVFAESRTPGPALEPTCRTGVLERAGLHAAELFLLEAHDEEDQLTCQEH